jgi:hypothetical protein
VTCVCLWRLSFLVKFLANPDTDASIRSLMGGAKGGGDRVTFAPFVTDKEQFLSVAQVRPPPLFAALVDSSATIVTRGHTGC